MKGFSLTEPWASAVLLRLKEWETRSWPTKFRGEFALHAAKGMPKYAKEFLAEYPLAREMTLGAVIAVCDLTDCRKVEDVLPIIGEVEEMYGDYSDGRYAFKIENVRPLKQPVYCRGALGFWDVQGIADNYGCGDDVERQIRERL